MLKEDSERVDKGVRQGRRRWEYENGKKGKVFARSGLVIDEDSVLVRQHEGTDTAKASAQNSA